MGDEAFGEVVTAYHAEIHRYLARVTGRRSDADDLSQETFLRAFRAHRGLPPGANVRAWLFTIATNLSRNHFRTESRRRRAHATAMGEPAHAGAARPDGEAAVNEASARLEEIVARLPGKQRLAFILRKIHELDYDEIAASLECSEESARAHVFQAVKKLRGSLSELAIIHSRSVP
jgi:RNA polymerase sigma-70 factor (ECF subfamily)